MTFTDIPAETKVYAEATAYKIENDGKQILYTGRSEEITIQEGENSLSLVMKKTESVEPSEPEEPSEPTEPEEPSEPEPTEPSEPEEPAEPVDPTEPSEPEEPSELTEPEPTEPEPVEPSEPVDPAEPESIEYTITFVLDGGQWEEGFTAPASCTEGEKLAEPEEPAKASSETSSYVFEGWYTSADEGETLSETPYDFDSPVTAELTLYAKWKEVPVTEISATISVEESSDINVTIDKDETDIDNEIIIYTFTADEGYESYTWKLDGEEVTATSSVQNTFQFSTQNRAAGTYDISLIVKKVIMEATEDTPAQYGYYSYEAHITVE